MAVLNPDFVISPNLQEYFVDKDTGLPLAGGKVFYYADNNRSMLKLKDVFELTGTFGNYAYTVLPNPLTLGLSGTTVDGSGNDIRVYYNPLDDSGKPQLYYIEVYDSAGTLQFTRQAWPPSEEGGGPGPTPGSASTYNFVRNAQFYSWNNGSTFSNLGVGSLTDNDYTADDWLYKSTGGTQTTSITEGFFGSSSPVPANAVNYMIYTCSAAPGGQTFNVIRQKYESALTLANDLVSGAFTFMSPANTVPVQMRLRQYFGTGGSPSADVVTDITIATTSSAAWTRVTGSATIPDTSAKSFGTNGDDGVYLELWLPLNQVCTLNFVNIQLNVGGVVDFPIRSNDDQNKATNYDNPNSIFKTGDVKMTLRNASDPGWLLMDDKTIGNNASAATHIGLQYKALYELIWTNFNNVNKIAWAPIFTNAGVYIATYGASAEADWNAGNRLSLTKSLGRVLAGAAPSGYTAQLVVASFTSSILTITNGQAIVINATPVTFSGVLPTSSPQITVGPTYYVNTDGTVYGAQSDAVNSPSGSPSGNITFTTSTGGVWFVNLPINSLWALGEYYGEELHQQIIPELVSHTHPPLSPETALIGQNNASGSAALSGTPPFTVSGAASTGATGGNTGFNIIQPTAYYNVMIKL